MSQSPFDSAGNSGPSDPGLRGAQNSTPDPFAAPPVPGGQAPPDPFGPGSSPGPGGPFSVGPQGAGPVQNAFADETQGGFGSAGPLEISRPPVLLLFVAVAIAVVAAVIAGIFGVWWLAIICWFLAGPVAIGLIALFVTKDNQARTQGVYAAPSWVRPFHVAVSILCVAAVLVPALRIADWVGRL